MRGAVLKHAMPEPTTSTHLYFPRKAQFLRVEAQHRNIFLWALHKDEADPDLVYWRFETRATGEEFEYEANTQYLGTVDDHTPGFTFVWHVFATPLREVTS